MSKKKDIYVPIVKDDKDICRLIFQKKDYGRYDIKLEFLNNSYKVQTYKLFDTTPIVYDVENPENVNISYHHGLDDQPIVIHLKKNKVSEGENRYTTLPATKIQPPNNMQKFPVPLLKIEIPNKNWRIRIQSANLIKFKPKS